MAEHRFALRLGFSAFGLSAAFVALRYASRHKVELRWAVLRWLLGGVWKSRQARDLAAEAAVFHLIEADVVKRSNYASILPMLEAAPKLSGSSSDDATPIDVSKSAVGEYSLICVPEHLDLMRSAIESRGRHATARACDAILSAALPHVRIAGRDGPIGLDDCVFYGFSGGVRGAYFAGRRCAASTPPAAGR